MPESRIIIAHDDVSYDQAKQLAFATQDSVFGNKANDLLLDERGAPAVIDMFNRYGRSFADKKIYDIPNTAYNTAKRLAKAGASIVTAACDGGFEMLQACVRAYSDYRPPKGVGIFGVTVLTSLDDHACMELHRQTVEERVLYLSRVAQGAGCRGIICSGQELQRLRKQPWMSEMICIVPGTRSEGVAANDQRRVMTPEEARKLGADILVIGREVTSAKDPAIAASLLNERVK